MLDYSILNYHLSRKLKLIERDKFNHSINTLTLLSHMGSNSLLICEAQHVEYSIKIGSK
jgi:hypothetical protein